MDLTGKTQVLMDLASIVGLASIIAAWVTLRLTVKHQGESISRDREASEKRDAETKEKLDRLSEAVQSLIRWRERIRGAQDQEEFLRGGINRAMPRTRDSGSGPTRSP